jgi:hypothetical protein
MRTRWITRTFAVVALAGSLSGCIYQPAPAYSAYPGYESYPYAGYPGPAYAPAPYYGTLNLGFGDGWDGHRRHWR